MELFTNSSEGGHIHTRRYTNRKSSSLTSLSKPSLSSGKVLSSQFQAQKLSSPASSSQTLFIPLLINTYMSPAESSAALLYTLTHYSYYSKMTFYSLHILCPRACPSTIMILLRQLESLSLSLPSSHTKFSLLFVIMEPIIFIYSFTIEDYDVTVTI